MLESEWRRIGVDLAALLEDLNAVVIFERVMGKAAAEQRFSAKRIEAYHLVVLVMSPPPSSLLLLVKRVSAVN